MVKVTVALVISGVFGAFCLIRNGAGSEPVAAAPRIHPNIFALATCWSSDNEQPVVTEINLDAVAKNRNQFDFSTVKENQEWVECANDDGRGFRRFKVLSASNGEVAVEYQSNSGGTFTDTAIIEYTIENRELRKQGKSALIRVLRIIAISGKKV